MADSRFDQSGLLGPSTNSTQPLTVEMIPRLLKMHSISESELDAIASGNGSTNLTFFGICLGAAISFGIVLYNGGIDQSHKAIYAMLFFVSLIMSAYFGVCGFSDSSRARKKLRDLKSAQLAK
jgi:hypothetical protein